LPLQARQALQAYLEVRSAAESSKLFIGERGPLTARGIRTLCEKYSALTGVKIYPHLLRHTMAHQFLHDTNNDLVALAQMFGHENLNTTSRYTQRTEDALRDAGQRMAY